MKSKTLKEVWVDASVANTPSNRIGQNVEIGIAHYWEDDRDAGSDSKKVNILLDRDHSRFIAMIAETLATIDALDSLEEGSEVIIYTDRLEVAGFIEQWHLTRELGNFTAANKNAAKPIMGLLFRELSESMSRHSSVRAQQRMDKYDDNLKVAHMLANEARKDGHIDADAYLRDAQQRLEEFDSARLPLFIPRLKHQGGPQGGTRPV